MVLDPIFDRFVTGSPLSVMVRGTIEHTLPSHDLDALFERTAAQQYTRELLFSSLVDLMSLVVCGIQPHIQAAFKDQAEQLPVTLKSVYEKLQRVEPEVSAELVRFTAGRCGALIDQLGGGRQEWLPGYRVKVVDGNHLGASQHRIRETRSCSAAPLPGLSLVLLDPVWGLPIDVLPCENGHAQERSLFGELLERVEAKDLWIADRNFCTTDLLAGIADRHGCFVIRHHANLSLEPLAEWGAETETETGWVSERSAWVVRDGQRMLEVRCIRVRLKEKTRDGETEVVVLTNLPVEEADAVTVAGLYRRRWSVETLFQELTCHLGCEVNTLGYPRAALFGFCVALVAYAVLAVVKAALRSVHGEAVVDTQVSGYYLALEMTRVYGGMMVALPPEHWQVFQELDGAGMARLLRYLASRMNLAKYRKQTRKPKKPSPKRVHDPEQPHVATSELLAQRKQRQPIAERTP
jgi:Transposase DDE domain